MATVYRLSNGCLLLIPNDVKVGVINPEEPTEAWDARRFAETLRSQNRLDLADAIEKVAREVDTSTENRTSDQHVK